MTGKSFIDIKVMMVVVVLFTFLLVPITAEEEAITLDVASTNIEMGMSTEVTLSIHNGMKVDSIQLLNIDQFEIISNSQSSSTQIINGEKSQVKTYKINLMPKAVGSFDLQAYVSDGKNDLISNLVTVTVGERNKDYEEKGEEVFITTTLSSEKAYLGEPVIITYDLYTRYNLEGFDFREEVSLDGVMMEAVAKEDLASNYVTIGGEKYIKYEAKKLIVNPIHSGVIHVPSYPFQANLSTGDFFSSSKPMYLETEAKDIEILPLPEEGRPADFSGLVGDFELDYHYDRDHVAFGDPVTMTVDIKGSGNLETLDQLYKESFDTVTIYETDKGLSKDTSGGVLTSNRSFEAIMIPKGTGRVTLPSLEIPYFNTKSGNYERLMIPEAQVEVSGEMPTHSGTLADGASGPITIHQVSYPEDHSDEFVLQIKKDLVKEVVVLVVLLVVLIFGIRWVIRYRTSYPALRMAKRQVMAASSPLIVYEAFAENLHELTGYQVKAMSGKEGSRYIKDAHLLSEINEVSKYFEYERFYKEQPMKTLKTWVMDVLKKVV